MRIFLKDMVKFPFVGKMESNKFAQFLRLVFKDYPAFLWQQPSFKKVLVLPFLLVYAMFKKK